jgi:hypothetical protein
MSADCLLLLVFGVALHSRFILSKLISIGVSGKDLYLSVVLVVLESTGQQAVCWSKGCPALKPICSVCYQQQWTRGVLRSGI